MGKLKQQLEVSSLNLNPRAENLHKEKWLRKRENRIMDIIKNELRGEM
jgi:hypothetical protein